MTDEAYVALEDGGVLNLDTVCTIHCPSCGSSLNFQHDEDPEYPEFFAACCGERWMLSIQQVVATHLRPDTVEWRSACAERVAQEVA